MITFYNYTLLTITFGNVRAGQIAKEKSFELRQREILKKDEER